MSLERFKSLQPLTSKAACPACDATRIDWGYTIIPGRLGTSDKVCFQCAVIYECLGRKKW